MLGVSSHSPVQPTKVPLSNRKWGLSTASLYPWQNSAWWHWTDTFTKRELNWRQGTGNEAPYTPLHFWSLAPTAVSKEKWWLHSNLPPQIRRENYCRFLVFIALGTSLEFLPTSQYIWPPGLQEKRVVRQRFKQTGPRRPHQSSFYLHDTLEVEMEAGLVSQTYEMHSQGPEFKWFVQGQAGSGHWLWQGHNSSSDWEYGHTLVYENDSWEKKQGRLQGMAWQWQPPRFRT